MEFYQNGPSLLNQFDDDRMLKSFLRKIFGAKTYQTIEADLRRLGERAATDLFSLAQEAEENPPVHIPYGPWGQRIDEVKVSNAWRKLDKVAAEEGIVAHGYLRKFGPLSRVYQFAKLYLYHPSSAIYSCPLAMTDGAARVIEVHGDEALKKRAFVHLTSFDPEKFWTSGQWMTERTGGSDVSGTSTVARLENGQWKLYGVKWFTSATTSQMAMALARIDGDPSGKLSLFYVELRDSENKLQNIQINRLKDKMGTKALPTAELTLSGTPAVLVGEQGKGVKTIATLFNITRVYNACCAVGYMRRGIALAKDYAQRRKAFGKTLIEHGLHAETLAGLQVRFEASFLLTFHAVALLGKEETQTITPQESATLRLLIPLAKLFTAKEGVEVSSEVVEAFGGAGYIEDTGIPQIARNAQVLAIWEGTTNVLSLDALRAIRKENSGMAIIQDMEERLQRISEVRLQTSSDEVRKVIEHLRKFIDSLTHQSEEDVNTVARDLAMSLSKTYAATLLLEHAEWALVHEQDERGVLSVQRWLERGLVKIGDGSSQRREGNRLLLS